ncbi:MAG: hypothetical protein IH845_03165 [Nanoarchaeota archaeon]|nr:hypothetical protein [Nanoarchaeota archaeon]
MGKPSFDDLNFLLKISSIYQATVNSAIFPVIVPSTKSLVDSERSELYSHLPWNEHENKRGALDLMKFRLENSNGAIERHEEIHKSLRDTFVKIGRYILCRNKSDGRKAARNLEADLLEYGRLLESHSSFGEGLFTKDPFLKYPFCPRGHILNFNGNAVAKAFNENQDMEDYFIGITGLTKLIPRFLWQINDFESEILYGEAESNHPSSTSLSGRIALNSELLKKARDRLGI